MRFTFETAQQRNAFQTANTLVSSVLISGFWHERSAAPDIIAQSNTHLSFKRHAHASPRRPYPRDNLWSRTTKANGTRSPHSVSWVALRATQTGRTRSHGVFYWPCASPCQRRYWGVTAGVAARGNGIGAVEAKRVRAVCEKGRSSTAGWGCGSRATFVPKT